MLLRRAGLSVTLGFLVSPFQRKPKPPEKLAIVSVERFRLVIAHTTGATVLKVGGNF